jgi:hypothetical protein
LRFALAVCLLFMLPSVSLFAQVPVQVPGPGIVFVAEGSGGLPGPAPELAKLATSNCLLRVELVDWTYGTGMVALDMWGHKRHKSRGQELADRIISYKASCPNARIYLLGHSSGAAVILAATECLPPGIVTRVILLAPSVSCNYDVRPAVACAYEGVDVFYSHRDMISLSMFMTATSDLRPLIGPAGYRGFRGSHGEDGLSGGLRQHPNCFAGHFACTQHAFLRDHVLPLICPPMPTAPAPPQPELPELPDDTDLASVQRGGIRATSYLSPVARARRAVEVLLPDDDFDEPMSAPQGPVPRAGRSGIAPISDSLRLP